MRAEARRVASEIDEMIDRVLSRSRTLNYLAIGTGGWRFLAEMVPFAGLGLLFFLPTVAQVHPRAGLYMVLFVCVAFWYGATGAHFRPYTMFDTRVQQRRTAVWKWVSLTLLTFVAIGTLLPAVRRHFFGF